MRYQFGPDHPDATYVPHGYPEHTIDLGGVVMNYASAGSAENPALLLIPGQTESWWGFEGAMAAPSPSSLRCCCWTSPVPPSIRAPRRGSRRRSPKLKAA